MNNINFKEFSKNCPWNDSATCKATTIYRTSSIIDDCEESECGLLYAINYRPPNKVVEDKQVCNCIDSQFLVKKEFLCGKCGGSLPSDT